MMKVERPKFRAGDKVFDRWDEEWTIKEEPDAQGYVLAHRTCDGAVQVKEVWDFHKK